MICDYCGSQAMPATGEDGVIALEPTKNNCPVCATVPLSEALIDSHELRYCAQCKGMLFEMDKFLPVIASLREQRYWSRSSQMPHDFNAGRVLHCPLCRGEMDHHLYGGGGNVAVDSCEACGVVWLDRSELSRIAAAPDQDAYISAEVQEAAKSSELS